MVDSEHARPPTWALADARRATLDTLLRDDRLEPTLWSLLFAPAPDASSACDALGAPCASWQIDWHTNSVVFRFAREPVRYSDGTTAAESYEYRVVRPAAYVRAAGRTFAAQYDTYLCGMHSLNTLARSLLLNPASVFETILRTRRSVDPRRDIELTLQREELFVAALREGVVLASVLLANQSGFESLRGAASEYPRPEHKCFESIVRIAGGLVVLFSDAGAERCGHFITVVPLEAEQWVVYSFQRVTATADTLGAALEVACRQRSASCGELVGLVPLPAGVSEFCDRWRESTLRNSGVVRMADQVHINTPIVTPLMVHAAAVDIGALPLAVATREAATLNLFTFYAARNRFESELNCKAEELARCLVNVPALAEPVCMAWQRDAAPGVRTALADVPLHLAQLGSLLRNSLGLLFAPRALLPNRDWLRYVVVYWIARTVRATLERGRPTARLYRLVAALAAVAFTWHRFAGETRATVFARYNSIDALYKIAIYWLSVDDVFGSAGIETPFARRAAADMYREQSDAFYFGHQRIDRALWLLHAARHANVTPDLGAAALDALDAGRSDTGAADADAVPALDRLRDVAFARPLPPTGADTVASRRAEFATRFQSLLADAHSDAPLRALLVSLGASERYADAPRDDVAIERELDDRPYLLEQACVQTGTAAMYGTVFDAAGVHAPRPIAGGLCDRVALRADGAALSAADYEPQRDLFRYCRPFDAGDSVVSNLGKRARTFQ